MGENDLKLSWIYRKLGATAISPTEPAGRAAMPAYRLVCRPTVQCRGTFQLPNLTFFYILMNFGSPGAPNLIPEESWYSGENHEHCYPEKFQSRRIWVLWVARSLFQFPDLTVFDVLMNSGLPEASNLIPEEPWYSGENPKHFKVEKS